MICFEGENVPFDRLDDGCFACCQKSQTMDMEYTNTYGYTEVLVYLISYVPGFKSGENYQERLRVAAASHGFNPEQINRAVFDTPERKCITKETLYFNWNQTYGPCKVIQDLNVCIGYCAKCNGDGKYFGWYCPKVADQHGLG